MIANRSDCRVVAGIDQQDGEQNGIPVYDSLDKLDEMCIRDRDNPMTLYEELQARGLVAQITDNEIIDPVSYTHLGHQK